MLEYYVLNYNLLIAIMVHCLYSLYNLDWVYILLSIWLICLFNGIV